MSYLTCVICMSCARLICGKGVHLGIFGVDYTLNMQEKGQQDYQRQVKSTFSKEFSAKISSPTIEKHILITILITGENAAKDVCFFGGEGDIRAFYKCT